MAQKTKLLIIPQLIIDSLDEMNNITIFEKDESFVNGLTCNIDITAYTEKESFVAKFFIVGYNIERLEDSFCYFFFAETLNDALYNFHQNLIETVQSIFLEEIENE